MLGTNAACSDTIITSVQLALCNWAYATSDNAMKWYLLVSFPISEISMNVSACQNPSYRPTPYPK